MTDSRDVSLAKLWPSHSKDVHNSLSFLETLTSVQPRSLFTVCMQTYVYFVKVHEIVKQFRASGAVFVDEAFLSPSCFYLLSHHNHRKLCLGMKIGVLNFYAKNKNDLVDRKYSIKV